MNQNFEKLWRENYSLLPSICKLDSNKQEIFNFKQLAYEIYLENRELVKGLEKDIEEAEEDSYEEGIKEGKEELALEILEKINDETTIENIEKFLKRKLS